MSAVIPAAQSGAPGLIVDEQQAAGTDGGAAPSASSATRTLNTIVRNVIGASLSINQITLRAGDYYVRFSAVGSSCAEHQAYLYNVTDAAIALSGRNVLSGTGAWSDCVSDGAGVVSIAASKAFELRHYTASARATDGLGRGEANGVGEVFGRVEVWRL